MFTALMFPLDLSKPQVYSCGMSTEQIGPTGHSDNNTVMPAGANGGSFTPNDGAKHTFASVPPYDTRPLTVESAIASITAYNRTKEAHGGTVPFDWNIVLTSELMLDVLRRIVKFS